MTNKLIAQPIPPAGQKQHLQMHVALIDHDDSFTNNVVAWLRQGTSSFAPSIHVTLVHWRDERAMSEILGLPLVLSPGPKRPEDYPPTIRLVQAALGKVPILGLCLGHQILAHIAGAEIVAGRAPWHGTTREVAPRSTSALFHGIAAPAKFMFYNSLVVDPVGLTSPWSVDARCDHGEVAALSRIVDGEAPAFGLQFHPESFLSQKAAGVRANWLAHLPGTPRLTYASATAPLSMPS